MSDRYILNGKVPVMEPDLLTWARWIEKSDRAVAKTQYKKWEVSTVFLGVDYNFSTLPSARPILFETMVFPFPRQELKEMLSTATQRRKFDNIQERYCTWEEAEAGHRRIVAQVIREA